MNRVIKICSICKNNFDKKTVYCSRECYRKARLSGKYKPYWTGKIRDQKTKDKISLKNKGNIPWCAGLKLTEQHKQNLSKSHIGIFDGNKHHLWKGGRIVDDRGYVRVWISSKKWKYEHRLIMEKILGRPLNKNEIVHHINQNKQDNRIENLMFFPNNKAHMQYHIRVLKMKIVNQYS